MKIGLSAESTCDLQKDLLKQYSIHTTPFTIIMGEETFLDGEVKGEDVFAYFDKTGTLPRTSAVNEPQYEEYFSELKKEYDVIIHIGFGGKMSSSLSHAQSVAEKLGNIYVIDSNNLSTGIALQLIYARKLIDAGKNPEEIVKAVEERVDSVQASFGIESVNYLYKGGRCSAVAAFAAGMFQIRPQVIVKDGGMIAGKKYKGRMKRWAAEYAKDTFEQFNNPDHDVCFITYSSADEEVLDAVEEIVKQHGFKTIHKTIANCTISSHCGPHCLGVLYYNDGDHPID